MSSQVRMSSAASVRITDLTFGGQPVAYSHVWDTLW